jgi:hypothetical protein
LKSLSGERAALVAAPASFCIFHFSFCIFRFAFLSRAGTTATANAKNKGKVTAVCQSPHEVAPESQCKMKK